jgi:predicted Fe-Mo cluster-binding NifX family protein
MKIAFPTQDNRGMESLVYGHFGSAPYFVIVDSDSGEVEFVTNRDREHQHGQCQPIAALGGQPVDAVIVGGMGAGALQKFNSAGIRIFRAVEGTVGDNLKLIRSGSLPLLTLDQTCAGHGHGGTCMH